MRLRLYSLPVLLLFAILVGGADGCSSDPNVEGAKLYIRQNEYDRALENLDKALETNPQNVDALVLKSEVYRMKADGASGAEREQFLDQAIQFASDAADVAPDNGDAKAAMLQAWALAVNDGNQALRNENAAPGEAAGLFELATRAEPDSMQGHFGLGLAYLRDGNAANAVTPLRRATEIEPTNPNAFVYLGRAYLLSDQGTKAIEVLQNAAQRFPDNEDIQTTLLNAYAVSGQTDLALQQFEAQLATRGNDPVFLYNYGALLLQADRFDEAITQLEKATQLDPSNADAFYNLGAALQNKASALNRQAAETTDNAAAQALLDQRDDYLVRSLAPLEHARELSAEADRQAVCSALFQVYTQLNRLDDANSVSECAGFSSN